MHPFDETIAAIATPPGQSGIGIVRMSGPEQERVWRRWRRRSRGGCGAPEEVLAEDLRVALDALGEITGDTTRGDVIDHIFARFCIGK